MTKEEIFTDIDSFVNLGENWDGYGAVPTLPLIGAMTKDFISKLDELAVNNISDVYPNPHGTLCVEWENKTGDKLSLEIGKTTCSYWVKKNEEYSIGIDNAILNDSISDIQSRVSELF